MAMLKRRLDRLERQASAAPGECQCVGRGPGTGWRFLGPESRDGTPPDTEDRCRVCGLPRPTIAITWVDGGEWRDAPGPWQHIRLRWPDERG